MDVGTRFIFLISVYSVQNLCLWDYAAHMQNSGPLPPFLLNFWKHSQKAWVDVCPLRDSKYNQVNNEDLLSQGNPCQLYNQIYHFNP